jgi:ribonuclease P protein component
VLTVRAGKSILWCGTSLRFLTIMSQNRYTPRVPPRGRSTTVALERFYVCKRYASMTPLQSSAPVLQSSNVDAIVAAARARGGAHTSGRVSNRRDLERVIGCAEANLSTKADQAHSQVWLSGPHGRPGRARRPGSTSPQGPPRAHRRRREQVHAEPLGVPRPRAVASLRRPLAGAEWRPRVHDALGVERRLRLRRGGDVRTARSRGKAIADGPLVLRFLPNVSDPPSNRYGVVAGRKSGGSVQRNRLKRVTREALRQLHPRLRPGFDLVVIIRGTVEELPGSGEARQLLTRMLRRAGLLETAARDSEQSA